MPAEPHPAYKRPLGALNLLERAQKMSDTTSQRGTEAQGSGCPMANIRPYKPRDYERLVKIMSKDRNLAIFRRFEELNFTQLVSLQAELMELQAYLRMRRQSDDRENPSFSRSFRDMRISHHDPSEYSTGCAMKCCISDLDLQELSQPELLCMIRVKLAEYSKRLSW